MRYYSSKTFTHSQGLSCCFRQWKADSHCKYLHGYAIEVRIEFVSTLLDYRNWVFDFGSCKPIKQFLTDCFDHKTIIAKDDPQLGEFKNLKALGLIDLVVVDAVGCEKFAELIFKWTQNFLAESYGERVKVASVEVREHPANSAIVRADAY